MILESGFRRWSEPWARLGIALSLWDEASRPVAWPEANPRLFDLLWRHAPGWRDRLAEAARYRDSEACGCCKLDISDGIAVMAFPLVRGDRQQGSIIACGITEDLPDPEYLQRLCSAYELDRAILTPLVTDTPTHDAEEIQAFADILHRQVATLYDGVVADRDIADLSSHLADAYEELNLLHRVSTTMSVSRTPEDQLRDVCNEMLATAAVQAFAVVLEPSKAGDDRPTVIRTGRLSASDEDIVGLYRQARDRRPNAGTNLVVNSVSEDPALNWAAPWCHELILCRLGTRQHHFGGVLAVNHRDGGEFGSQESQLLATVFERGSAFLENVLLYEDLEQLFMGLLHALVNSIDAKDPYTCGHSQRVAWLSRRIAIACGVAQKESQAFYLSGLLHDIGKIGIPETVLCKKGRLSPREFAEMRRHPQIGAAIVEGIRQVGDLVPGILHHHERFDGHGYPHGLKGHDIPLIGRVLCLADSFDAMTTNRTYRRALPLEIAMAEIRKAAGTQFDPEIVETFLRQDLVEWKARSMVVTGLPRAAGLSGTVGALTGGALP